MQKEKKHNGIVSLWKFIFALVIAFFHTNQFYPNNENPIFRWGYIAVEFYFIITGFYFAKKVLKEDYKKIVYLKRFGNISTGENVRSTFSVLAKTLILKCTHMIIYKLTHVRQFLQPYF